MEFLTCTAQSLSSDQANMVMDLWNKYEDGESKCKATRTRRSLARHSLYDIYCSAHHDQCSLIIRTSLAARRGGCGPAS
jgi:hypothetical protein